MSKPVMKFRKRDSRARTPRYATSGAGAFDIAVLEGGVVPPTYSVAFRTGLEFEVPEDHVMLIFSRSGHGFKDGIRLSNCVGLIDSDYRGEVAVKLHNDGDRPFEVEAGERIAQAVTLKAEQFALIEVEELSSTDRGENGFGSTGRA